MKDPCTWCTEVHDATYLCNPAKMMLDKIAKSSADAASKFDLPTIELKNELEEDVEGILCQAIAVKAFYTDTLGVIRPGIALEGVMVDGRRITPLLLIDEDVAIRRAGRLFDDMAGLAVRRARRGREEARIHRV